METSENSFRSRYGIDKLQDHNYHSWSWNCELLLREKDVWQIVTGELPCPVPTVFTPEDEEKEKSNVARTRRQEEKAISE